VGHNTFGWDILSKDIYLNTIIFSFYLMIIKCYNTKASMVNILIIADVAHLSIYT